MGLDEWSGAYCISGLAKDRTLFKRTWSFHVVFLQRTAKKCTRIYNARAQPLFHLLSLFFGGALFAFAVVVCLSSLITAVMKWIATCRNTFFSNFFCLLSFGSSAPAQKSGILRCLCPWWRISVVLVLAWTTAGGYASRRKINPSSLTHWRIYWSITFTCRYLPMVQLSHLILFRKRWVVLIVCDDEGKKCFDNPPAHFLVFECNMRGWNWLFVTKIPVNRLTSPNFKRVLKTPLPISLFTSITPSTWRPNFLQ